MELKCGEFILVRLVLFSPLWFLIVELYLSCCHVQICHVKQKYEKRTKFTRFYFGSYHLIRVVVIDVISFKNYLMS